MGYPERVWLTVQRIKPGDTLICYVQGVKRFVGAFEVVSEAFQDNTQVWKSGPFPSRVRVKPSIALRVAQGVPFDDIRDALQFYKRTPNPGGWGIQFQNPPRRIEDSDALVIEQALRGVGPSQDVVGVPETRSEPYVAPPAAPEPEGGIQTPAVPLDVRAPAPADVTAAVPMREHDHMQWLLLNTGSQLGLDVWVARNDRGRSWEGRRFSEIPRIQLALPHLFVPETQRIVENIDVLWLRGSAISSAFEIEHTTSIYSGILRMADLVTLQPNLNIKLFLVSPEGRRAKVRDELNRPTFRSLRLNTMCKLITFERLEERVTRLGDDIQHMKPEFIDSLAEPCDV